MCADLAQVVALVAGGVVVGFILGLAVAGGLLSASTGATVSRPSNDA